MYYDEAPATDARHARTTLNDLTKELREFSEAHRDARRSDEAGSRKRANRARGRLIVEYERLKVLQHNFPIEFRERINTTHPIVAGPRGMPGTGSCGSPVNGLAGTWKSISKQFRPSDNGAGTTRTNPLLLRHSKVG